MSTPANFDQWYHDTPGTNLTSFVTVSLQRDPVAGTYVWDSANTAQNGGKDFFDPIGTGGWVAAGKEQLAACAPSRNVSFTSETHFWFEYQGGEHFDFAGDDDTWVFLNDAARHRPRRPARREARRLHARGRPRRRGAVEAERHGTVYDEI